MAHLPFPPQRAALAPPRVEKLWMPREHTLEDLHELLLQEEKALRKKMKAASLSGSHRIPPFLTAPFVDPNTERDVVEEDYDSERDEHHLNDGLDDDDGYDDEEEEDDNGFPGQAELREGTEERTPSVAGQEHLEDLEDDNDDMELDMDDIYVDPSEYVHDVDEETHHLHQQFQYNDRHVHDGSSSPELHQTRHFARDHPNHRVVHPEGHAAYTDSDYEMIGHGGPTTDQQLYTDQEYGDDGSDASEYWEDPEDEEDRGPYRIGSPGHTPRPSPP